MRWRLSHFAILFLIVVASGMALWRWGEQLVDWSPKNPPQLVWTEFEKLDAAAGPVRLAGPSFCVVVEQMFDGSRDQRPSSRLDRTNAKWRVTLHDDYGQQCHLVVYKTKDGDFWSVNGSQHPLRGDIELLLEAKKGIELLDSTYTGNAGEAEAAYLAAGDTEIDSLIRLATSRHTPQRVMGLRALTAIVSPRVRAEARLFQGGQQNVAISGDPRGVAHPRADEIRAVALAVIDEWLKGPSPDRDNLWLGSAALALLDEVGDVPAIDVLAKLLRARADADHLAETLMAAIERFYARPPLVTPLDFCPTGESAASIARAEREALSRRRERRKLVLEWHEAHRDESPDDRLRLAMRAWEPLVDSQRPYYTAGLPMLVYREFQPFLRQGAAIVPLLRSAQSRTGDLLKQASYEVLIAIVTGDVDPALIAKLNVGDAYQRELARQINAISAAE